MGNIRVGMSHDGRTAGHEGQPGQDDPSDPANSRQEEAIGARADTERRILAPVFLPWQVLLLAINFLARHQPLMARGSRPVGASAIVILNGMRYITLALLFLTGLPLTR